MDCIQATLIGPSFKMVNVSPLGKGYFRIQFESADHANVVLAQSLWTSILMWVSLPDRLVMTARFPGLLPKFVPHIYEIGISLGVVVGDRMVPDDVVHTVTLRMVFLSILALQFVSPQTIHGEEISSSGLPRT